jgi:hypothetical protein
MPVAPPLPGPPPLRRFPAVSTVALVAANAIPLVGVILLGWRVFPILLIYWLENVTAGVFNVLRMLTAQPDVRVMWIVKFFLIPFFCFHYGMFTAVHGSFVFSMFGPRIAGAGLFPTAAGVRAAIHDNGIGFAVIALVMSHAVSFALNWLIGGEFRRVPVPLLMVQPYQRVMVLHLVIIGGGAAAMALGSPVAAIMVLVVVKTALDLNGHARERATLADPTTMIASNSFLQRLTQAR